MHPLKRAQIAYMKIDEAASKVPSKYTDFVNVFSPKLTAELLEYTEFNDHVIKLVDDQQLSYSPIYSLKDVELKTLKTYYENNLAYSFIKPFKSPT